MTTTTYIPRACQTCDMEKGEDHKPDCRNRATELKEFDHYATNPDWVSPYADEDVWEFKDRVTVIFGFPHTVQGNVTTWMGTPVGKIVSRGNSHRDNMGGQRRYVRVRLFTGALYGGWMTSAKQFINLRKLKDSKITILTPDPRPAN